VSKAVAEGESQFSEFMMTKRGKQLLEEFKKMNDPEARLNYAQKIHELSKEFRSKSNGIRSKLLSFNPKTIVMEEISKHDNDGNYPIICASNNFDLPLVMFLVQAGQVTPVNFNGESIIIKTSDKIGQFYVKVLEILINSGEFNKEDGSNILQRLVEEYTPEADISIVRRIIYYCNNGPDGTVARPNRRGETLLHHVQSEDLYRFLIQTGAPIDSKDYEFRTPLHSACER
jgi:ankyrin repeat protein